MELKIRKATPDDWETIQMIQKKDGFSHAYYLTHDRIQRLFSRGETFFMAEVDGAPVGFSSVDYDIRARLHFLSVIKEGQGKGVGRALLNEVIKEVREKRVAMLYTVVEEGSPAMNLFLERAGFKVGGQHRDRFYEGRHGVIWNLRITQNDDNK